MDSATIPSYIGLKTTMPIMIKDTHAANIKSAHPVRRIHYSAWLYSLMFLIIDHSCRQWWTAVLHWRFRVLPIWEMTTLLRAGQAFVHFVSCNIILAAVWLLLTNAVSNNSTRCQSTNWWHHCYRGGWHHDEIRDRWRYLWISCVGHNNACVS